MCRIEAYRRGSTSNNVAEKVNLQTGARFVSELYGILWRVVERKCLNSGQEFPNAERLRCEYGIR